MSPTPVLVPVKRAYYLGVEGAGAPESSAFRDAVAALYAVAFTIKMARKFAGADYAVAKLEGLWWVNLPHSDFLATPRHEWQWKLMIRIPEFITPAEVAGAISKLAAKGKAAPIDRVQRFALTEGKCVQMLHVGPYATEPVSIGRMRAFAEEHSLRSRGAHHEIYLSDPRRVAPEKLRTILRQPVGR